VRRAAKAVAPRYHLDFEECISAGNLALTEAARTYNPSKNPRFDLFAYARVAGEMIDSGHKAKLTAAGGLIRAARELTLRAADAIDHEPNPFDDDSAFAAEVSNACDILAAAFVAGLGAAKREASGVDEELIKAQDAARDREAIDLARETLPDASRAILDRHLLGGEPLTEVAEAIGMSERNARRYKRQALEALKNALLYVRTAR
jgi:RNA polymerase sigma factor for flagellar operon FliA